MSEVKFRDTRTYAHYESGVRESMNGLPAWTQRFLTWLTGHARDGQQPVILLGPVTRLALVLLQAALLVAGMTVLMNSGSWMVWMLLPFYWLVITGILRSLQLVYGHHAVHNAMSTHKGVNQACALLCTTLPLVMNENDYKETHLSHHRFNTFCTEEDDDSKFLMTLGFRPGRSRKRLWLQFLTSPVNPLFHYRFLSARFRSNFTAASATWPRRISSLLWVGLLALYGFSVGWLAFGLVIIVPLFFLYNFSALMNFMTEHSWMNEEGSVQSREQYESKCWGRFCGQRYPENESVTAKTIWWLWMLFYHLPVRLFALVGDVTVHDVHHLYSYPDNRLDWVYDIYRRQQLLNTDKRGMASRELWGLHKTIDSVFIGISQATVKEA